MNLSSTFVEHGEARVACEHVGVISAQAEGLLKALQCSLERWIFGARFGAEL